MFSMLRISVVLACSFLATSAFSAVARNAFNNMDVKTSYSELIRLLMETRLLPKCFA